VGLPESVEKSLTWVADGVAVVPAPAGRFSGAGLLIADGDTVLVDAGMLPETRAQLAPHVDVCILTSCGLPQMLGAADFRTVWAPRAEARALLSEDHFMDTRGVAAADRAVVRKHLEHARYRPARYAKTYRPGGLLALQSSEWSFVPAAGPSPGTTLLLDPKRHILFAGPFDLADEGPWYGWPDIDLEAYEQTLERLLEIDVAVWVPTRGEPRRRGIRPALRSWREAIDRRDDKLTSLLATPHALDELVRKAAITGRPSEAAIDRYHERIMIEKHLARLLERQIVRARQDGRYVRED